MVIQYGLGRYRFVIPGSFFVPPQIKAVMIELKKIKNDTAEGDPPIKRLVA